MNQQSIKTIKRIFLDYNGRMSREGFAVTYVSLILFFAITFFSIALCVKSFFDGKPPYFSFGFFFITFLGLLTIIDLICILYSMCVVYIKRFHDLDLSGWYFIIGFTPLIELLFLYLILVKGNSTINEYGDLPLPFKVQFFDLIGFYVVVGLYTLLKLGLLLYLVFM